MTRMVAGIAFALSPRILTEVGALSIEAWPSAIAPWVLVPLVGLAKGASIRRSVALSALAVACAGGVNATAVFAVVPLAVIWLLTLAPARGGSRLCWPGARPCCARPRGGWFRSLVLGQYSPPFLDYIETAAVTTGATDAITVLRGCIALARLYSRAIRRSTARRLARSRPTPLSLVATIIVAVLGLAGLARRGMPHRRFLVAGLTVGLAMVGLGHVSDLPATFAQAQRDFLDGIGAPLRNVHKFDVLLRLPLTLGLAHLLGVYGRVGAFRRNGLRYAPAPAAVVGATAFVAIVAIAAPALAGNLAPDRGFKTVPRYWQSAADWLNSNARAGSVLVLPGVRFPNYTWGDTLDEITQPLLSAPWAVRNAIPLTPPGTIRMMDAIESALSTGYGSRGLADYLARSGVKYLLVRSDLNYGSSGATRPILVKQALERTPGLSLVTGFGPTVGADSYAGAFIDHGLGIQVRALEIFQVDREVSQVVAYAASDATTVVGGPESLLALAEAGVLTDAPTILAGDLPSRLGPGPVAITDGLRRRDVSFGSGRDNTSATLTPSEAANARDYLPAWGPEESTTVAYRGVATVVASSSRADPNAPGGSRPEHQPFAALDGDVDTSWRPASSVGQEGQWLEITLAQPTRVPQLVVNFDPRPGALPTRISVDVGPDHATVEGFAGAMTVNLAGINSVRTIRLTIEQVVTAQPTGTFGIAEVQIPGVTPERTLVVPAAPAGAAATVVMSAAPSVPACFFVDEVPRCAATTARGSEDGLRLDRTLTLAEGATYQPSIWARARPGSALDSMLDRESARPNPLGTPTVVASSTAVDEPAGRAGAVLDGNHATVWAPSPTDSTPMLRFLWLAPRSISGLRFSLHSGTAATQPGAFRIVTDDGMFTAFLSNGEIQFGTPIVTQHLTIFPLDRYTALSFNPYTNAWESLPVAISEVTFLPEGAAAAPDLDAAVNLSCGSGPTLRVGGSEVRTRLRATLRDLVERREVPALPCDDAGDITASLRLEPGGVNVAATASELATATRVALNHASGTSTGVIPTALGVVQWSATERRLRVPAHAEELILAVRENTNPGWLASIDGRLLAPIVVDGWQQGWVVPAGVEGEVQLSFVPDRIYRTGLLAGAGLLLLLVVLAAIPVRRRGSHVVPVKAFRSEGRVAPFLIGGAALIVAGGLLGAAAVALALAVVTLRTLGVRRRHTRTSRVIELLLPASFLLVGGWLALTIDHPHSEVWPQAFGILAVASVWLSVSVLVRRGRGWPRTAPNPLSQALARTFDEVVAQRGQTKPDGHGGGEDEQRLAAPQGRPLDGVDRVNHYDVPEEQAERDSADPPQSRVGQHPV